MLTNYSGRIEANSRSHYGVCGIKVFETDGIKRIESSAYEDHLVVLMKNDFRAEITSDDGRMSKKEWKTGDLLLHPKDHKATAFISGDYSDAVVRLSDKVFRSAARDHIDYDKIKFRMADVTSDLNRNLFTGVIEIAKCGAYQHWPLLVESTTLSLAVAITKTVCPCANAVYSTKPYGLGTERRKMVLEYIEDNLYRPITLDELAKAASMSKYHFSRLFKTQMGMTPVKYLAERRVEAAKVRMRSTSDSLAEIALSCGFASQSHMTTVFTAVMNTTPAEYRKSVRS